MPVRIEVLGRCGALALLLTTGGCAENFARRDTISYASGDATAANRAIQIIEPWPRRSFPRGQATDGEKAAQAVRRYRAPEIAPIAPPLASPATTQ